MPGIQQSIPASKIVSVQPNVLSAGGTELEVIGLILSTSPRVPVGTVQAFADKADVAAYFGADSQEASLAGIYFSGFIGASVLPESVLFAQYNTAPVAAYVRGGNVSELTLPQLQALSGTLLVTMDGYAWNGGTIDLSDATSFSDAAATIDAAFDSAPVGSAFTASIGFSATGTGTGTSLALTAVTGLVSVGDSISGTGVPNGTTITAFVSGTPGGAGTYTTSVATTAAAASITGSSTVLNVTAKASGSVQVGQVATGVGVTDPTSITAVLTGAVAGIGTYRLSGNPQNVSSESMTGVAPAFTVTFDSVSGAFVFTSGITGVVSTAAFPTGTLAAPIFMTQATGAVTSQGAAGAAPGPFMDGIIDITQNWVTFMTAFDPDDGSGNTVKKAFADWENEQNNQFAYVCWDLDVAPTTTVPATESLGYQLQQEEASGTFLVYGDANLAAFVCGTAAAINFNETNGRITFAFRQQAGILPTVTSASVGDNLVANGYNFYGGYATRNQAFTFLYNGQVSGEFKWFDSYINQIWLNNSLQLSIMTGLTNVKSIPYNSAGYALIEAFCADPINAALNFGAIRTGVTLSAEQIAEVNQAAGKNVAPTLQTRGWYLQVQDASPQVRANRGSPPCTLWYTDGGAVQHIDLDSIEVQ